MTDKGGITGPAPEKTQIGHGEELSFVFVSTPSGEGVPYQAPDLPPHFVPRAELLAIKRILLGRPSAFPTPLVLHGPPGSGKTALAAALAHDSDLLGTFPDGVLWVSLGEDADPQHAQAIWGAALGNDLSHLPDPASRSATLRALLRDSHCLLVLDDVTDIEQVRTLNVGGPNCVRLITTNREEIAYALKARRYLIDKMSEGEALHLLTEWAGMMPDIYLPTVKEIIKRLSNSALPLALVGAQARQGITWLRLLEVLRDDQGPISIFDPDDPLTRDNALGLIVNLVLSRFGGAQLQRSALLGAFAAGSGRPFSAEAAAACWEMPVEEARSTLELLVEAALVHRTAPGMYALHEALRDHLRRSSTSNALTEAEHRVCDYYLGLIEQGESATPKVDAQLGQIMQAFRRISAGRDEALANVFADALIAYFERRGLWANLITLTTTVVKDAHDGGDVMREYGYLNDLGYAHTMLGNLDEARRYFKRSLEISQELGDPAGEAAALNNIGAVYEREGKLADAQSYYERSLAIREKLGVLEDTAEALNNVAGVLYVQGRLDDALSTFRRVLDMYTVLNDRHGQARTWLNIGAAYEGLGNDDEARRAYQNSLAIYANLGDEAGQAQALNNLGIICFNRGEIDRALAHFKRSLTLKERIGDRQGQASTLNNIALLYEKSGALSLALENYERSYGILKELDDPRATVVQENIRTLRGQMEQKKAE
ncbi:MAG TPA: tetratricopeptide repeat protein [Chloroflexi bacterium]|nr:tetratricopeptide repeat protein [Chloroflexota bacterium]